MPPTGLVILIMASLGLYSCFQHFYQTNSKNAADSAELRDLVNTDKYFILHTDANAYAFSNPTVSNDTIKGDIAPLPLPHQQYLAPRFQERNRFRGKNRSVVLYEVHLYTHDPIDAGHASIPVKDIFRLDAYSLDKTATNTSKVFSIVGVTLGTALVVGLVIAATTGTSSSNAYASSGGGTTCSPKVYLAGNNTRQLAGVLYSGAIFAPLERTDYLPLPETRADDEQLHLQVQTAANEELYIHDVSLLRITHPSGTNVLADRHGRIWSYSHPIAPDHASIGDQRDVLPDIAADDQQYYGFTNHPEGQPNSDIVLDFKKPKHARSGRLIVKARNSLWGAYVFKGFKALYGEYYQTLLQVKDKADKQKLLQCELDQSMPLSVSVQHAGEWTPADFFYTTGNDAPRYMIMDLDLTGLETEDHVSIRLQTAFQFWDLDYAAMDYSKDLPTETARIPVSALDTPTHITDKDTLHLDFNIAHTPRPGYADSYFLVGAGYYHDNTRYPGKPQLDKLGAFSSKGAFDKFSRQQFEEMLAAIRTPANTDANHHLN